MYDLSVFVADLVDVVAGCINNIIWFFSRPGICSGLLRVGRDRPARPKTGSNSKLTDLGVSNKSINCIQGRLLFQTVYLHWLENSEKTQRVACFNLCLLNTRKALSSFGAMIGFHWRRDTQCFNKYLTSWIFQNSLNLNQHCFYWNNKYLYGTCIGELYTTLGHSYKSLQVRFWTSVQQRCSANDNIELDEVKNNCVFDHIIHAIP